MTDEEKIKAKLKGEKCTLESIITEVGTVFKKEKTTVDFVDFDYDLEQSKAELKRLFISKDCRYDRPTIGYAYSYCFQLQRMNQWINFAITKLAAHKEEKCIEIIDVGSGLNSVMWAFALVRWAVKECDPEIQLPTLKFYNIDNSSFQTEYAIRLWENFALKYKNALGNDPSHLYSTSQVPKKNLESSPRWLTMSFLFDASDVCETTENLTPLTTTKDAIIYGGPNIETNNKFLNIAYKQIEPNLVAGKSAEAKMETVEESIEDCNYCYCIYHIFGDRYRWHTGLDNVDTRINNAPCKFEK